MRGGRAGSLAASPTLVGAVTVLVVIVAVFLSYQANRACPSSRPTSSRPQLPNANTLVPGNEVRVGGIRVGQIESVEPITTETVDPETGQTTARVAAKAQHGAERRTSTRCPRTRP